MSPLVFRDGCILFIFHVVVNIWLATLKILVPCVHVLYSFLTLCVGITYEYDELSLSL